MDLLYFSMATKNKTTAKSQPKPMAKPVAKPTPQKTVLGWVGTIIFVVFMI